MVATPASETERVRRWTRRRRTSRSRAPTRCVATRAATTAVATAIVRAAQADVAWPVPHADAQATGPSSVDGPGDPGLRWHIDLDRVEVVSIDLATGPVQDRGEIRPAAIDDSGGLAEITTGTTDTTFDPEGLVTRAQMASLPIRAIGRVE